MVWERALLLRRPVLAGRKILVAVLVAWNLTAGSSLSSGRSLPCSRLFLDGTGIGRLGGAVEVSMAAMDGMGPMKLRLPVAVGALEAGSAV